MGPKKKKEGKGKSKQEKLPFMINGVAIEEMSRDQIEDYILQIREELNRERQERNYFQVERDKVFQFWEVSKEELKGKSATLRNKEHEMEEAEEKHQIEIKIYKQKVKHLMYEYQNNLSELKGETATKIKNLEDDQRQNEKELYREKKDLKTHLKEQELQHEDNIKNLKMKHEEFISKLRMDLENHAVEERLKYDKKMQALNEELDLRRKNEIHEIEERKSQQMNLLIKNHEKAFTEIKNYYNDIILNNLALINTLKEQIEEVRRKEEYTVKNLQEANLENKKLTVSLQKSKEENQDLLKKLHNYDNDKMLLKNCKGKVKELSDDIMKMNWELKLLEQKYEKVESERDEIYKKLVAAIHEVHQKSNLKNLILEKKLNQMAKLLEKKEMQLHKVILSAELDPHAITLIATKIEEMMNTKNHAIQDLQYELGRVCKAHNDIIRTYEAKLQEFSVPTTELGFEPLPMIVANNNLGQGPADLVTKPVLF